MANEIRVSLGLTVNNNGSDMSLADQRSLDQTAQGILRFTQNAATSDAALDLSKLTVPGWAYLKNLDATNYIDVGPASGSYLLRLLPAGGAQLVFLVPGAAVHIKSAAGTPKLDVSVLEK